MKILLRWLLSIVPHGFVSHVVGRWWFHRPVAQSRRTSAYTAFIFSKSRRSTRKTPQRSTFEGHMDDCPTCQRYLETYEDTIRMGKLACEAEEDVPEDVPEALIQAILAARGSA